MSPVAISATLTFDGPSVYKANNRPGVSTIKGWELSAKGLVGENYEVSGHVTISKGFDADWTGIS